MCECVYVCVYDNTRFFSPRLLSTRSSRVIKNPGVLLTPAPLHELPKSRSRLARLGQKILPDKICLGRTPAASLLKKRISLRECNREGFFGGGGSDGGPLNGFFWGE